MKTQEIDNNFYEIANLLPQIICEIDNRGNITYINKIGFEKFGYAPEDLNKDLNLLLMLVAEDRDRARKDILRISRENLNGVEYTALRKEGTTFPILVYTSLIILENKPIGFRAIVIDITEQKNAEQKLKESEEKFRTITEQSLVGIAIIQDDEIKYVNEQLLELTGYSMDEIREWGPQGFAKTIHPDDRTFIMEQAIKKQKGLKDVIDRYEMRITKKNGEIVWLDNYSKTISYEGRPADLAILVDISKQKHLINVYEESEEKYRLISENANDLIAMFNPKLSYKYINEKVHLDKLGYSSEDLLGKNLGKFIHPDDLRKTIDYIRVNWKRGEGNAELRFKKKDGTYIWLEVAGRAFRDSNGRLYGITISRDITERKLFEKKLKKSEERYRLITENANDVVWTTDMNLNLTYISPSCPKILGYTIEEAKNLPISKPIAPSSIKLVFNILKEEMRLERKKDKDLTRSRTFETEQIHKDGSIINVEMTITFIRDKYGKAIGILGVSRDITERKKAEKSLKESEIKYRRIFDGFPNSITLVNSNGIILDINPATERIYGYTRDEVIGKNFADLGVYTLDQLILFKKRFKELLEGKELKPIEIQIYKKNGSLAWINYQSSIIREENEILIEATAQDITERKIVEQKLKESEEKLRKLNIELEQRIKQRTNELEKSENRLLVAQKIARLGFWDLNVITDELYWSDETYCTFGFKTQEFVPTYEKFRSVVHPDDIDFVQKNVDAALQDDIKYNIDFRIVQPNGDVRYINAQGDVTRDPTKDKEIHFFGTQIDITERKRAELELKKSEKQSRNIIENLPMGIHIYQLREDGQLYFIGANPKADQILGIDNSIYLGRTIDKAFPNIVHTDIPKKFHKIAEKGGFWHKEEIMYEDKHIKGAFENFNFQSSPGIIVSMFNDISERRRTEQKLKESEENLRKFNVELEQKIEERTRELKESEEKYREAYNHANFYKELIAHDMNNLLHTIQSSVELYTMFQNKPEYLKDKRNLLDIITKQVFRGAKIVSNIIKLSELEETEIAIEPIDVSNILKNAIEFVYKKFQGTKVKIEVDTLSNQLLVKANDLILDLFENILINAVKHNKNPEIEIRVKISEEQKEKINYLKFEFIDNGIGIPDEIKDILFQRVYKKEGKGRGLGIGLSLVKQIIDNYNGKIWIENRVKEDYTKGSNFIFLIPKVI